jgi:hypothetical protein
MKKNYIRWFSVVIVCGILLTSCFNSSRLARNQHIEGIANQVWTYSLTHPDGFTIDLSTMTVPTKGIVVAYEATQGCHSREKLNYVISHAMAHNRVVGGWFDTSDSLYYFDSSRIFPEDSLEAAKKFGIENGQIAIFLISEGKEIRLK